MSKKVTPLDKEIAGRIRELREERGMHQPTVAGVLGVTYQSYQKIEQGKVSFRASTLAKLAELFGVPVSRFYEDTGNALENGTYISHLAALLPGMSSDQAQQVYAYALTVRQAA
jgi:transcriptional regulator with XRE-family HTH domain